MLKVGRLIKSYQFCVKEIKRQDMIDKGSNDSVRKEQFSDAENTNDAMNEKEDKQEQLQYQDAESPQENKVEDTENTEVESETGASESETVNMEKSVVSEKETEVRAEDQGKVTSTSIEETDTEKSSDKEEVEETTESSKVDEEAKEASILKEKVDYSKLSQDQLVNTFELLMQTKEIANVKNDLEIIRSVFYKNHHAEIEKKKAEFIDNGGVEEAFSVEPSPLETRLKDMMIIYREKRDNLIKQIENEKENNLQKKHEIIDAIHELVHSQESLNKTFQEFRDLQEKWRLVGPVPQNNVKELWEKYHFQVEAFYDYIKINKELRDLDFKKNLEAKIKLCEKAEEYLIEPSVVEAFRGLQMLHDQWREIGPIPVEKRTELWDRFKDATTKINKRHQEYFVKLKQDQKKNLEEKTVLCEKAEVLAGENYTTAKEWDVKSKEIIELQKIWKTIGFAPKKYNTKIYERFRAACDAFFNNKRGFFSQNKEEQQNNLQLKMELCVQAEALKDSTDWKKTTNELISLQKKWKEVGPVSAKQSDKIWKRFRSACDEFFNRKSDYYKNIDSEYEGNLKLKEELIKEIEGFEFSENVQANLDALKQYQRRYSEIGFVPIKKKEDIQNKFRETINARFDQLRIDDKQKNMLKFKTRIDSIANKPNADRRLNAERDKCVSKIQQLENDIALWGNNIGFFANSKNAEQLIKDVEAKIETAKEKIKGLKQRVRLIDQTE